MNLRSTLWTSVIVRAAFEATGTLDIDFVPNNVVGAFLSRSFLLANITGTARGDCAESRQRIGQEVDLRVSPFWELWFAYNPKN